MKEKLNFIFFLFIVIVNYKYKMGILTRNSYKKIENRNNNIHILKKNIFKNKNEGTTNEIRDIKRIIHMNAGNGKFLIDQRRINLIGKNEFSYTLKPQNAKATNQYNSGRCWIFALLNVIRNIMIKDLDLPHTFELSETYVFFWDRFERMNCFFNYLIENDFTIQDRIIDYYFYIYIGDGGWFQTAKNIILKYGICEKSQMRDTINSYSTQDLNEKIEEFLRNWIIRIKNWKFKLNSKSNSKIVKEFQKECYNLLVDYLGKPPNKFELFKQVDKISLEDILKNEYKDCLIAVNGSRIQQDIYFVNNFLKKRNYDLEKFHVFTSYPGISKNTKYTIKHTRGIIEMDNNISVNVSIEKMKEMVINSISSGIPVWFSCDVMKDFDWEEKVFDYDAFSYYRKINNYNYYKTDRSEEFQNGIRQATHAMSFVGFDYVGSKNNKELIFEVENSWGHDEYNDGYYTMTEKWFTEYVTEISVSESILTTDDKKIVNSLIDEKHIYEPWNNFAPAKQTIVKKY